MSTLKEALDKTLTDFNVTKVKETRNIEVKGVHSLQVEIWWYDASGCYTNGVFTFAEGNKMDAEHKATVIHSYMRGWK